jgi:hypothetical protein
MNQYFYMNWEGITKGPVPASDLLGCGITKDAMVWREGMSDGWKPAGSLPELSYLFSPSSSPPPPPFGNPSSPPPPGNSSNGYQQKPDNLLVWSILATIFCCWPAGIPAIVYSNKVDKLWNMHDYTGAREAVEKAKMWCFISLGGAVIFFALFILIGIAGALK